MKKMNKIFSVLLSLSMVIMCLAGCSDKDSSSNSEKPGAEKPKYADVFTIAMASYGKDGEPWNLDGEYGEAFKQMLSEIEAENKITIEIDYYDATELRNIAQTSITNGDTEFADIVVLNLHAFGPLYAQGLFKNLNEIPGLDLNADFWNPAIKKIATFKDGCYGIGSSGLLNYSGFAVYYNKNMVKSLGIEDPAELVKKGNWTWDKLRELSLKAVKDLNNDGEFTDADRYGCTSQAYDGLVPAWLTCGVDTIKTDASGRLVYNMLSKEAVTALQKFKTIFTVNDGMFYAANLDGLEQQHQFMSGNALFLMGGWTDDEEPTDKFEIGILPYPKYNAKNQYSSPSFHNERLIAVPAITERPELVGKVIQLLGEKSKDFHKLQVQDDSVNFVDRDAYVEMRTKYIDPYFNLDRFNLMLNVNEAISSGTMRAIAMPIFADTTYSMYTEANVETIQSLLDEMFNK